MRAASPGELPGQLPGEDGRDQGRGERDNQHQGIPCRVRSWSGSRPFHDNACSFSSAYRNRKRSTYRWPAAAHLRDDLVEGLQVISDQQLVDAVAIGQITPGPVFATATFIGYLIAGTSGAIVATIGMFLPSFVLVP
jgi:hypothetical protein